LELDSPPFVATSEKDNHNESDTLVPEKLGSLRMAQWLLSYGGENNKSTQSRLPLNES
jgi:hypothetical protein